MAGGVITRGTHPQLLIVGLKRVALNEFEGPPREFEEWCNVDGSSTKDKETTHKIAGLTGIVPEKAEGGATTYDETVEGGTKEWVHKSYGLGVQITHEMQKDEQYGKMNQLMTLLGRAGRNLEEISAASMINNMTNTATAFQGFDALPLVSTAHTNLKEGANQSNRPSVNTDIGYTAIQNGLIHFRRLKDDSDIPTPIKPSFLIINPEDEFLVDEILLSSQKPFTADNEVNTVGNKGLKKVVSSYLTDDDLWLMLAAKGLHTLTFMRREATTFDNDTDFDTGNLKFKMFNRHSVGFDEWRGSYGTPGA